MLRQLLTLLAVISGLGLSAAPAVATEASVISIAASGDAQECASTVSRPLALSQVKAARSQQARPFSHPAIVIVTPAVQLRADRARE